MEASETNDAFGTPAPEPNEPVQEQVAEDTPQDNTPEETASPPDLGEQMAALTREVQGLRQPEEPQGPENLYEQLSGYPGEQEDEAPYGQEDPAQGFDQQQEADPFDEIIRERVAEATHPILMQMETERRSTQLNELAKEHPELHEREYQDAITDRLGELADRYGNEMILTDPDLVRSVLIAEKAARASASEVPAESAAGNGAKLESSAGAVAREAELTAEDQIKKGILGARNGGDAFT